jgi:hypothetical protein
MLRDDFYKEMDDYYKAIIWWRNNDLGPCRSSTCPVKVAHPAGRFCHNQYERTDNRHFVFGTCIPPPEIWWAYDRLRDGRGSNVDAEIVDAFRDNRVFQGRSYEGLPTGPE